jgi:hypothetical protein
MNEEGMNHNIIASLPGRLDYLEHPRKSGPFHIFRFHPSYLRGSPQLRTWGHFESRQDGILLIKKIWTSEVGGIPSLNVAIVAIVAIVAFVAFVAFVVLWHCGIVALWHLWHLWTLRTNCGTVIVE